MQDGQMNETDILFLVKGSKMSDKILTLRGEKHFLPMSSLRYAA